MAKTYYEHLGVTRHATVEEIKSAYKEIAKAYHPDSHFYDEIIIDPLNSPEIDYFKQLTQIYKTLIDDFQRIQYDKTLPAEILDWDRAPRSHGLFTPRAAAHCMELGKSRTFGVVAESAQVGEDSAIFSVADYIAGRRPLFRRILDLLIQ